MKLRPEKTVTHYGVTMGSITLSGQTVPLVDRQYNLI